MEKGKEGFLKYYQEVFGDRWPSLKEALEGVNKSIPFSEGLLNPYHLDEASVLAAKALSLSPGDQILDMCAAPGGKSLVIASRMGCGSSLTSNELSRERRERLKRVFREHLPQDVLNRVRVTGFDAAKWLLYEKEAFDKIFIDAPCSSERHILASQSHLDKWSPARIKHLSIKQFALLASALEVVKPGGLLVYCTCSISPQENDGVITKLLSKRSGRAEILFPDSFKGEKTLHGTFLLPDAYPGLGPIYYSIIQRI